jgi:hypothetical protein
MCNHYEFLFRLLYKELQNHKKGELNADKVLPSLR